MSLSDAQVAQGLATFHRKSVEAVVEGLGHINALLRVAMKKNKIKWDGYGTYFDWYVRKLDETASWSSGQLGTRTFTERDPVAKATLPYCYLDATYGISEVSIKSNRAAGIAKIFDIQKENARVAEASIYRALATAMYNLGTDATAPVGLQAVVGNPYDNSTSGSTGAIVVPASKSYAGIVCTGASNIVADDPTKASYTNKYWAGTVASPNEIVEDTGAWSTKAIESLIWMQNVMARTKDISGTGELIKPDMALMPIDPYIALVNLMSAKQTQIPLGNQDLIAAGFQTIKVGSIDCVYDENVPTDTAAGGAGDEMVFVVDSNAFAIETWQKKSEGLIEGEWDAKDVKTVGGVGLYKTNLGYRWSTPQAVGCLVGCNA